LDTYCSCSNSIDIIGISLFFFLIDAILKRFCDGLKLEMAKVVIGLIKELYVRFFEQSILDAMGVVYHQYWL
jgi:hypothetical protein